MRTADLGRFAAGDGHFEGPDLDSVWVFGFGRSHAIEVSGGEEGTWLPFRAREGLGYGEYHGE